MLRVRPCTLREANAFVRLRHRHASPTVGCRFAVSAVDGDGRTRGVAIAGRPVSRQLDDGLTLEVLRVCTDGVRNGCSLLYGACRRAGRAMGYQRFVTYTLVTEPGVSLVAAGWHLAAKVRGRRWDCPSRPRGDNAIIDKFRWESR